MAKKQTVDYGQCIESGHNYDIVATTHYSSYFGQSFGVTQECSRCGFRRANPATWRQKRALRTLEFWGEVKHGIAKS